GLSGAGWCGAWPAAGIEAVALRRGAGEGPRWDPERGVLDSATLTGFDAVVHLAGATIAGRFTSRHRARIRASRVDATRLLAERLVALDRPPRVLVSASAVGWCGDRGGEPLAASGPPGRGVLPRGAPACGGATPRALP